MWRGERYHFSESGSINMRIIHCADLHLDSAMRANLDPIKRKERKLELLDTYCNMVKWAEENGVSAILIAGDLFDSAVVSKTTMNAFLRQIVSHPQIDFYYLRGNHDATGLLTGNDVPPNLHFFDDTWTKYVLNRESGGNLVLNGIEFNGFNHDRLYETLSLNVRDFNLVMMHGQTTKYNMGDKTEYITLERLKNLGIDYLALGHVHAHVEEPLDGRGVYCFSGCLEGRGFDECGEHGFMLLEIDEGTLRWTREFIPFARRTLYTVEVDISDCMQSDEIISKVRAALSDGGYSADSLVKIILTGQVDLACEKDLDYILHAFEHDFYVVKLYDDTKLLVDFRMYAFDESLKGEFVRNVLAADLSDDEKGEIIHYGLRALGGEEILK